MTTATTPTHPHEVRRIDRRLLTLLGAWISTRLVMVLLLTVDSEVIGAGDIWRYNAIADALVHSDDPVRVWEYPLGSLAVTLPPLLLGAREVVDYLVVFVTLSVAFDLSAFLGVLLATPRGEYNRRGGALWVAGPFVLGLVSLTRIDMAACAAASVGAALIIRHQRHGLAAAILSMGALIKLWPAILLLGQVAWSGHRRKSFLGAAAPVVLMALITTLCGWWYIAWSFADYQRDRGLQIESLLALPLLWLDKAGLVDYGREFRFGAQQITGPGVSLIAGLSSLAMIAGLAAIVIAIRSRRASRLDWPDRLLLSATLAVFVLVLTNKVFSGQYMLWLILVVSLCLGSSRLADTRAAAYVLGATVLTHLLFPSLYPDLADRRFLPVLLLTLRDAVVIAAAWRLSRPLRMAGSRET